MRRGGSCALLLENDGVGCFGVGRSSVEEGGARIETARCGRGEPVDVELARHLGDADEQRVLADGHAGLDALGAERVDDAGAR